MSTLIRLHLLGLLSLFCILFSYKKLQQNFRLSTEISLPEQEEHSLNRYAEEAKTRYDETKPFRDIDICVILSNALDNAIQAVKNPDAGMEKYIHVSGRIQGDFLTMEIENSFHGKDAFRGKRRWKRAEGKRGQPGKAGGEMCYKYG